MKTYQKISALITAALMTLSLTACSLMYYENTESLPPVDDSEAPVEDTPVYPEGIGKLLNKYENDLLKDIKKNGLSAINTRTTVTGWNPEKLEYCSPEIGCDAVLSFASLDGIDVSLIAHNITHLPDSEIGGNHTEDCNGTLCAERVLLYLKDNEGRKTLSTQINSISFGHHRISGECLFDGSTRIYKTEQDGEVYYLLMQFAEYNDENDALIATFYVLDMELYEIVPSRDENGISGGGLWIIDINDPEGSRLSGWGQAYQASKSFEYKEGTTFYDPEYGYEITFDMKKGKASVTYTNE